MKKLYIIAHTWQDVEMTIETFWNPEDCLRLMGKLVEDGFEKPQPGDTPETYLDRYGDWREENEVDEPDYYFILEILEIE